MQMTKITMPSEATLNKIVAASMEKMADFATRATPNASYTAEDIAATVMADPTSETARFLAGLIAKSIEVVATLDYVESI
jgi:hypothetical protein